MAKEKKKHKVSRSTARFHKLQKAVREAAFGDRDRMIYELRHEYKMKIKELADLALVSETAIHDILNRVEAGKKK